MDPGLFVVLTSSRCLFMLIVRFTKLIRQIGNRHVFKAYEARLVMLHPQPDAFDFPVMTRLPFSALAI